MRPISPSEVCALLFVVMLLHIFFCEWKLSCGDDVSNAVSGIHLKYRSWSGQRWSIGTSEAFHFNSKSYTFEYPYTYRMANMYKSAIHPPDESDTNFPTLQGWKTWLAQAWIEPSTVCEAMASLTKVVNATMDSIGLVFSQMVSQQSLPIGCSSHVCPG